MEELLKIKSCCSFFLLSLLAFLLLLPPFAVAETHYHEFIVSSQILRFLDSYSHVRVNEYTILKVPRLTKMESYYLCLDHRCEIPRRLEWGTKHSL